MSLLRIGGIRPLRETRKLERGFWNAAVPSTCVVPLQQHSGSRLTPMVKQGDVVREGMVIADGEGRFAVPVHAPIPGRVSAVGTTRLLDDTVSPAIMIELAGEFDRLGKEQDQQDWTEFDAETLRGLVRSAGVVTTGRFPVPLHLYLRRSSFDVSPVIVLDLAETEPYLTGDAELTATNPAEVAEGFRIAMRMLDTEDGRVVASGGNRRPFNALRAHLERTVRAHRVPHHYPVNLEHQIRRVALPARERQDSRRQVLVITPSTAFTIYEAVVAGKPQIERVIAVGGGAVVRPAHIRVRIGTSVADVLEECGGLGAEPVRIIAGGPLTGSVVSNVSAPLTKTVSAVLALTEREVGAGREAPCIRCGACIRACPVSINPVLIHDLIVAGRHAEAERAGLADCVECGLCAHLCPARIPLVDRIREGKARPGEAQ